jgi:hypothetical protein
MPSFQAKLKPEFRRDHPELSGYNWYEVVPLWPGVTKRTLNLAGDRLARLKTPSGFAMVAAAHLEFKEYAAGDGA